MYVHNECCMKLDDSAHETLWQQNWVCDSRKTNMTMAV